MIPVKQKIVHDPKTGAVGDCWIACIASLLEYDINDIPHFMRDFDSPLTATIKWLDERGYLYTEFHGSGLKDYAQMNYWGYHMIVGVSPRFASVYHAVIGLNGEPVFDPHPDGTMILGEIEDWDLIFIGKKLNGK